MNLRYTLVAIFLLFNLFVIGQSSLKKDTSQQYFNFEIDFGAGVYYQFSTFGSSPLNEAILSKTLLRRGNDLILRNTWSLDGNTVTDQPSFHGSYFFNLGGRFTIGQNLTISAAINAEQRGFSDGVFSSRTRNFFPYLNAKYANKIGKFSYLFQVGDFRNFKLYEGLTFDNLETQSWIFKLKYGNFYFKHAGIGDLLIGIGLGIDDVYDYAFGLEDLAITKNNSLKMNMNLGYSNNRQSFGGGFWNFSGKLDFKNQLTFYTQVSMNQNQETAYLLGTKFKQDFATKIQLQTAIEYRSYSADFNNGYTNTVYYRNPNEATSFVNSTNIVFVPLDYYERDFLQWAIFTEYQNTAVQGFTFNTKLKYNFYKKLFLGTDLDFNWLFTENENILYPFYNLRFGVSPDESTEFTLAITNKVLNLDKNYPTFYATNRPYLMLRLYRPLKLVKQNDQQHYFN